MTADAVGGIWTYALDLGAALRRRNHRVTIAALGPGLSEIHKAEARAHDIALVALRRDPEWLATGPAAVKAAGRALVRLAQRVGADLVHLNHPALAAGVRFGRPLVAVNHSCVATWWDAVRGGTLPDDFKWRAALVERGLAAADATFAPTRAFAEETRRVYGFSLAPAVVPNGRVPPPALDGSARSSPALSVFTAGRLWDEGKNVAALDRAAPRIPVPMLAAGSLAGPNGATITLRHSRALGLLDAAAVRAILADRPVYASAAIYEPFGLAVLEAAQAGCALVLSDIATFRELWDGAALFVPAHDERAIAAGMMRVLGEPAFRAELARAAIERAATYTPDRQADGTESQYRAAFVAHSLSSHATAAA